MSVKLRKCDGCGKRDFDPAPMLRDEVWSKHADARELLCIDCMWRRQHERHVSITIDSLKPCPGNASRTPLIGLGSARRDFTRLATRTWKNLRR